MGKAELDARRKAKRERAAAEAERERESLVEHLREQDARLERIQLSKMQVQRKLMHLTG